MMRWLFFVLLFFCQLAWANLPVKVSMRDSGYTLGDTLHMRVEVPLPNAQIDMESLPLEGRAASWLDLQTLKVSEQHGKTVLDLTWQLFGTVEFTQPIKLPEIAIKTVGKNPQTIQIPAQTFYYSAVLPRTIENEQPRPNLPPLHLDEVTPKTWAIIFAALALLTGLTWAWVLDKLPILPFQPGPLTRLSRQFKLENAQVLSQQELQQVHHALNLAAGQSLYPQTLGKLFETAPYLQSEQVKIRDFFAASWQGTYSGITRNISAGSVQDWLKRAALAERMARKTKR
ncbi:MAG TPA: hypothetical protein PL131_11775 [Methylotenera sp.]|nr:hypothetical protein [Methylotenera sp.]HPH06545.1 hypothetical protein [Methylotenera sp.]HPN01803.1 hypothetical protein [Methylotenera sp.]